MINLQYYELDNVRLLADYIKTLEPGKVYFILFLNHCLFDKLICIYIEREKERETCKLIEGLVYLCFIHFSMLAY